MDGILLLDKPRGWTSHDAVDFLRRALRQKRIGHAGTLDPMATGLLVMLVGAATKLSASLTGLDKDYRGSIRLGIETDSWDLEGKVLKECAASVTLEELRSAAAQLTGAVKITPPSFSAIKKDGKKYCDLARKGILLAPAQRQVTVAEFRIERYEAPEAFFFVSCSKGTYIRSLAHHLGEKLGCGACLSSLVRTRIGNYHLKDALNVEQVQVLPIEDIAKSVGNGLKPFPTR